MAWGVSQSGSSGGKQSRKVVQGLGPQLLWAPDKGKTHLLIAFYMCLRLLTGSDIVPLWVMQYIFLVMLKVFSS